ncbi:hypothetical protein ACFVAV_18695 [Nocardia sp. NPDC057663]|uniref:hypothetical protein n=1 Tax=Nocardia sp. NPDC057663 TaxID=3346201 RepID=UPI003670909A
MKQLRRGHGLLAPDVVERIGPALRRVCGITGHDSAADVRRKLTMTITEGCSRLPQQLRQAAVAALALDRSSNQPERRFLRQRVQALAATFDRDPRTAARRIDEAFLMLAELLAEKESVLVDICNTTPGDTWYTDSLRATLYLDEDPVRLIEERRIVSTVPELDTIVFSWSVSSDSSEQRNISANILSGGSLTETLRIGRSHVDFRMKLAKAIGVGQRHDYSASIVLGPRDSIRPYYVVVPWRVCRFFRLRIRFGPNCPDKIWRINGLPPVSLEVLDFVGDRVLVDVSGQVELSFFDLQLARSYGVGWQS